MAKIALLVALCCALGCSVLGQQALNNRVVASNFKEVLVITGGRAYNASSILAYKDNLAYDPITGKTVALANADGNRIFNEQANKGEYAPHAVSVLSNGDQVFYQICTKFGIGSTLPPVKLSRYNGASNTWDELAVPEAFYEAGTIAQRLVSAGGKLYAFGGKATSDSGNLRDTGSNVEVRAYDPISNSWTRKASLLFAVPSSFDFVADPTGRYIYVLSVGGEKENQRYDVQADVWTRLPGGDGSWTPEKVNEFLGTSCAANGERVYCAGLGEDGKKLFSIGFSDLSGSGFPTWRQEASAQYGRKNGAFAWLPSLRKFIVSGGGRALNNNDPFLEAFDPSTGAWSVLSAPTPKIDSRFNQVAVAVKLPSNLFQ